MKRNEGGREEKRVKDVIFQLLLLVTATRLLHFPSSTTANTSSGLVTNLSVIPWMEGGREGRREGGREGGREKERRQYREACRTQRMEYHPQIHVSSVTTVTQTSALLQCIYFSPLLTLT